MNTDITLSIHFRASVRDRVRLQRVARYHELDASTVLRRLIASEDARVRRLRKKEKSHGKA